MSTKAYSREERRAMIIQSFAIMVQHGQDPRCTATRMARKLGLEPSTHFRSIMTEMAQEGVLCVEKVAHRSNRDKSVYSLPEGSYQELFHRRSIVINAKGKVAGQLELFS